MSQKISISRKVVQPISIWTLSSIFFLEIELIPSFSKMHFKAHYVVVPNVQIVRKNASLLAIYSSDLSLILID